MRLLSICFLFLLTIFIKVNAQKSVIDSMRTVLVSAPADTNRVTLLWKLAEKYRGLKPDSTLLLAGEGVILSRKLNYIEGESRSLAVMASGQYLLGNYPKALSNYMGKLQLEERRNSKRNYASALNNIGLMYILLGEYSNALAYLRRADSTVKAVGGDAKKELENSILVNLGETFYRMRSTDSAREYFSEALRVGLRNADEYYQGAALLGLGNLAASVKDDTLALANYRRAFQLLNNGADNDMLCETAQGLAVVYERRNNNDSALKYASLAYRIGEEDGFLSRELDAANFLGMFYKKMRQPEKALFYMEKAAALTDSLKGQERTRESMIISTNEQLRQAELAAQLENEKRVRVQQLQILVICIFIPLFFILTIVFSRVRVNRGLIRFMGVVSLLMVFEFLTLLLHPLVGELTHHNRVLELLIFVLLGAGLVPLHHRLETTLLDRLTKSGNITLQSIHEEVQELIEDSEESRLAATPGGDTDKA